MIFKVIYTVAFFLTFLVSVAQVTPRETNSTESNAIHNKKLTYKIINGINNTYCYDIYADDKLMIHQPSIPGLSGNEGFKTRTAAENIAQLVISKIKKGEMPPSVTIEEMKKLKALS
jgi:hypothetical protein